MTKVFKLNVFRRGAKARSERLRDRGVAGHTGSTVVRVGSSFTGSSPATEVSGPRKSKAWNTVRFVGTADKLLSVIKEGTLAEEARNTAYYYEGKFIFRESSTGTYYTNAIGDEFYNDSATGTARADTYYISNADEIYYYTGMLRKLTNKYSDDFRKLTPMPFMGVTSATLQPSSTSAAGEVWFLSNLNQFALKVNGKFYGGWPEQLLYQDVDRVYTKMYYSPNAIYIFTGETLKQYK